MKSSQLAALVLAGFVSTPAQCFAPVRTTKQRSITTGRTQLQAKGFGAPPPEERQKSQAQTDREAKESKYDDISATGGQEYRVFVRQFGSDDKSWLPVGSIAVPRGGQVSDAIFSNTEGLKTSIVRAYPNLKGMEMEFEVRLLHTLKIKFIDGLLLNPCFVFHCAFRQYGYNLKIYPDDPVQVAVNDGGKSQGPSIGNWISNLLSPVDDSAVAPPPVQD